MQQFKNNRHRRNYNKKVKRIGEIKEYYKKLKAGSEENRAETLRILKVRFAKGLMTKEEYDIKLSKYS